MVSHILQRALIATALACLMAVGAQAQGQIQPVAVSTLATTSGVVTVTTSAAHGLVANQGFCLSAPASVCGVVLTTPLTTTLTFSGNQTCVAACGTIQAAKQIIILSTSQPDTNQWAVMALFWLTTAQGLSGSPTSAWSGASNAENAALGAGLFIERAKTYTFATSLPIATVKATIQADYNAAQQTLAQSIQPAQYFGVYFNGAWSQ